MDTMINHKKQKQPEVFCEISQNSEENTCASLFFNKVAGLRPETFLKKRLCTGVQPVSFVKFLRTPFLQNTSGRMLLKKGFRIINDTIYTYLSRKN